MARVWLVAVALTLGAATPETPGSDYDLVWTAFAREVRWQTGESQPVRKEVGDSVTGATVNGSGSLVYEARRVGSETTLAQIVAIASLASSDDSPLDPVARFIGSPAFPRGLRRDQEESQG